MHTDTTVLSEERTSEERPFEEHKELVPFH